MATKYIAAWKGGRYSGPGRLACISTRVWLIGRTESRFWSLNDKNIGRIWWCHYGCKQRTWTNESLRNRSVKKRIKALGPVLGTQAMGHGPSESTKISSIGRNVKVNTLSELFLCMCVSGWRDFYLQTFRILEGIGCNYKVSIHYLHHCCWVKFGGGLPSN